MMIKERISTKEQKNAYVSPWSIGVRLRVVIWFFVSNCFFRIIPKPINTLRILVLKLFGCRIFGVPFVSSSAIIKMPWNLELHDHSCIGDRAEIYNLGLCTLKKGCTVAQMAYLCGGTHDFTKESLPLIVGEIVVGEDAFIGAKAIVLPGIHIGDGALIGAGSVVTKDMPKWMICAGNPCKPIKARELEGRVTEQELV
jgi:putative colanic acid biosynthesis acetyltransferase WcaF